VPVIEVRGLSKRFGTVTAVDGLSFGVEAGTVTRFLGPNDAAFALAGTRFVVRRDVTWPPGRDIDAVSG
jgi:ABC-type uncharacterized transport system ATPase subunit